MNPKQIKALAEILEASDLSVLEVCEGDLRVRLERNNAQPIMAAAPAQLLSPTWPEAAPKGAKKLPAEEDALDFNRLTEIPSPMVGVFYAAPSPDAEPFVKRGDKVRRGDVLCIIEAMKLLNEITADVDGEIADICVQNGQVVEFGQTLFKLF